jgi:hypothetical protein
MNISKGSTRNNGRTIYGQSNKKKLKIAKPDPERDAELIAKYLADGGKIKDYGTSLNNYKEK